MAKILCVDDDQYLTDLLRYALAREGFEVRMAHSGRDALRLIRAESLDLIILDVNIPDMNGFKVLSSL
ncbi:MAG TPA: response regulator, partial [Chloroflexota bacterium]|nr:response regulator [Chloroflexota bacterium]